MEQIVRFKGKRYELIPRNLNGPRSTAGYWGEHLGSLDGNFPGMSQPQVYKDLHGFLTAAACTCDSQWLNREWEMVAI
jgi:hypothetical protein